MELEDLHDKLLSQAVLFEIPQPEPNVLLSTKKTLRLNKQLWDFVNLVRCWIDVWKSTLWNSVDTEYMDMELKRFAKELKGISFSQKCFTIYYVFSKIKLIYLYLFYFK